MVFHKFFRNLEWQRQEKKPKQENRKTTSKKKTTQFKKKKNFWEIEILYFFCCQSINNLRKKKNEQSSRNHKWSFEATNQTSVKTKVTFININLNINLYIEQNKVIRHSRMHWIMNFSKVIKQKCFHAIKISRNGDNVLFVSITPFLYKKKKNFIPVAIRLYHLYFWIE